MTDCHGQTDVYLSNRRLKVLQSKQGSAYIQMVSNFSISVAMFLNYYQFHTALKCWCGVIKWAEGKRLKWLKLLKLYIMHN